MLGKRELGHIHGDRLVDIPFPKPIRDELVNTGQAEPHHILQKQRLDQFLPPVGGRYRPCHKANAHVIRSSDGEEGIVIGDW